MESYLGVDIKLIVLLTLTLDRASVLFHSSVYLLSRKELSKITKENVEIWYSGIS
jgi:hypothetical protein